MTHINTNLFPAILDACKRLPSACLGVRADDIPLCVLFDEGVATYGERDKKAMQAETVIKDMERTVEDCIANGKGVLITVHDEARGKTYSAFYFDGDVVLNSGKCANMSDLLSKASSLDVAQSSWTERLEMVRRNVIPAAQYIPKPISNTREYLKRMELSIRKCWQPGQQILIPDVIACGVVFADVLTGAFGGEWEYGTIGCEDIAIRIGKATCHPFLRVIKLVRDSEWTLTSVWDWLDSSVTNVAKEGEEPIYRVTASSPETLERLRRQLGAVEDNSEAGVLDMLLRMSDDELQMLNGHSIKNVKQFRQFLRRKKLKRHPR